MCVCFAVGVLLVPSACPSACQQHHAWVPELHLASCSSSRVEQSTRCTQQAVIRSHTVLCCACSRCCCPAGLALGVLCARHLPGPAHRLYPGAGSGHARRQLCGAQEVWCHEAGGRMAHLEGRHRQLQVSRKQQTASRLHTLPHHQPQTDKIDRRTRVVSFLQRPMYTT